MATTPKKLTTGTATDFEDGVYLYAGTSTSKRWFYRLAKSGEKADLEQDFSKIKVKGELRTVKRAPSTKRPEVALSRIDGKRVWIDIQRVYKVNPISLSNTPSNTNSAKNTPRASNNATPTSSSGAAGSAVLGQNPTSASSSLKSSLQKPQSFKSVLNDGGTVTGGSPLNRRKPAFGDDPFIEGNENAERNSPFFSRNNINASIFDGIPDRTHTTRLFSNNANDFSLQSPGGNTKNDNVLNNPAPENSQNNST